MKKILRKSLKAVTLVEIIVVMAIFGLVVTAALVVLGPVTKIYKSAYLYSDSVAVVDNVSMYIEDNIRYASRLHILDKAFVDPASEDTFIAQKVEEFREYYCFDDGLRASEYDPDERIYVMKIHCPNIADIDAEVIGSASVAASDYANSLLVLNEALESGKISTWEYEAYTNSSAPLEHKEWAVNRHFYDDYSFTCELNTDVNLYNTGSASTFCLDINLFHNDRYQNQYTEVTNTHLDNTVAFSLMNVSTDLGAIEEDVMIYRDRNDHSQGVRALPETQFRYLYKDSYGGPALSDLYVSAGNDIYLFYTKCVSIENFL